jgi:hypothetical protein
MNKPPGYYPPNLDFQFAADVFDLRFVDRTAQRNLTPLGVLLNVWYWYEKHEKECGPAFKPIQASIRELLEREAPDQLEQLK